MVIRNDRKQGRQQVVPRRHTTDWKTSEPEELKRQLHYLERNLLAAQGQIASLMRIVDGNQSPKKTMPERALLEFAGDGVALSLEPDRVIATIAGFAETWTEFDVGALSGSQNNFNGGSSTSWQAADFVRITSWSSTRTFTGFEAPSADATRRIKWICNATGSDVTVTNASGSSSAANRVLCSQGLSATIKTGEVFPILHDETTNSWRLLHRRTVERSGDTMDSGANLVFQAGDITGLDDLTFNGSGSVVSGAGGTIFDFAIIQMRTGGLLDMDSGPITNVTDLSMVDASSVLSMFGGDITGVDDLTFNGSGSVLDLNGGDIVGVDDFAFNGSGSLLSLAGGDITGVDDITMNSSSSDIDGASGTLSDWGSIELVESSPSAPTTTTRTTSFTGDETTSHGALRTLAGGSLYDYPVFRDRQTGKQSGDTIVATVDITNIDGIDFTGVPVRIEAWLFSWRADTSVLYPGQFVRSVFSAQRDTGSGGRINAFYAYLDDPNASQSTTSENFEHHETSGNSTADATARMLNIGTSGTTSFTVTGTVEGTGTDRIVEMWVHIWAPIP